jgi:glycerol-3-phosphate acyltransferase PlsY
MESFLLTAVLSYLMGSIPFGYLLIRIFRGEDVRRSGSGSIGATNVSRKSPALGVLTLLLDALKGSGAVMISVWLNPPSVLAYVHISWYHIPPALSPLAAERAAGAALFAILGHMFPIWLRLRGGKGVATGLGSFVVIAPEAVAVAVCIFVMVWVVFRYVSLGSIVSVLAFPPLAWFLHEYGDSWLALGVMSLASLLIVGKHHENIRRLLAGTESRFGLRRGTRPESRPE